MILKQIGYFALGTILLKIGSILPFLLLDCILFTYPLKEIAKFCVHYMFGQPFLYSLQKAVPVSFLYTEILLIC